MEAFLTKENIFLLAGGLGLFLYGIKLMGESLKALAGDGLRDLIDKYTANKYVAVLVGIVVTIAIQSSSGTTSLVISLVRAGLMSLTQSIGIIMGANIGTTVTAFLLGLSIKSIALPIICIGAFTFMFAQRRKTTLIGQITFGFGLLFYGMSIMEIPLKSLSATPEFEQVMISVASTPFLGILIGAVLTFLVQSSSATIGILQGLYFTGAVSFPIAFAILIGDNIGTTITSMLSALGGSRDSKRAALSHVILNVVGAIMFFIPMYTFGFIDQYYLLVSGITDNLPLQIAFSHFFFNITVTGFLILFIKQIESIVRFLVPRGSDEVEFDFQEQFLDEGLIHESPALALVQGENAFISMLKLVNNQVGHAYEYVDTRNKGSFAHVEQIEVGVNIIDKKLKIFLRDIAVEDIDILSSERLNCLMYSTNDIERIGDLSINIVGKIKILVEENEKISVVAKQEIMGMLDVSKKITNELVNLFENNDGNAAVEIYRLEKILDKMERKYYKLHLSRVKEGSCTGKYIISYVDLLSDIERIGDHAENIANYYTNVNEVLIENADDQILSEIMEENF